LFGAEGRPPPTEKTVRVCPRFARSSASTLLSVSGAAPPGHESVNKGLVVLVGYPSLLRHMESRRRPTSGRRPEEPDFSQREQNERSL